MYADEVPVGFVMLEDSARLPQPTAEHRVFLWRFMIDAPRKGQGLGRAALRLVIEDLKQRYPELAALRHVLRHRAAEPAGFL